MPITLEEFKQLRLIDSIYDTNIKYIRQQGWDPVTVALGFKPKYHVCGRWAPHRRLPINFDTIRNYPNWHIKINEIFDNIDQSLSKREIISQIYQSILYDIWFNQIITIIQRKFRKWTYSIGNPGYIRLHNSSSPPPLSYSATNTLLTQFKQLFCCCWSNTIHDHAASDNEQHDSVSDNDGDWSD